MGINRHNIDIYILLIVPFVVLLLINGCATGHDDHHVDMQLTEVPEWYTNRQKDNVDYWHGFGSGETIEGAVRQALVDVASRLKISLSSTYHEKVTLLNEQYDLNIESKIDTKIDEIKFSGFELVKSEKFGNAFYALVKVNKGTFLSDRKNAFYDLDKEIERIYSIGENLNEKEFEVLANKINEVVELSMLINSINGSFDVENNLNKYVEYKNGSENLKRKKLIKGKKKVFVSLDKEIETIYADIKNKSAVEILKECESSGLDNRMNEAAKLARDINNVDSTFIDKQVLSKYSMYKNNIDSVRNSVSVFLDYDQNSKYVAANIREQLNNKNIKTTQRADKKDRSIITVEIKSLANKAQIDGANRVRLDTTVIVRGASNTVISSNQFVTSGRSYVDFEMAFKNASESFLQKANEKGVLEMLGLTWLTYKP